MYNIPTGPSDYPTPGSDTSGGGGGNNNEAKAGRPSPFMVNITLLAPFFLLVSIVKALMLNN